MGPGQWTWTALAGAIALATAASAVRAAASPLVNGTARASPTSRRLQSLFHADLTTWEQYGSPSAGDWAVRQDRIWLDQNINGHPTYYVAPFDVIETTVTGTFGVSANWDDDYLGFVFGLEPGATAADDPKRMILFDWSAKPGNTREGFRLMFIDTDVGGNSMNSYIGWSGVDKNWVAVSPDPEVSTQGWIKDELYDFKAFYGADRITIWMRCYAQQPSCANGVFGSDYRLVFDVASSDPAAYMLGGSFPDGRFGFYDYSQASTRYGRFLILCPLGHYCLAPDLSECAWPQTPTCPFMPVPNTGCSADNQPNPCPAGTYGDVEGLTSALCSGSCNPGHYCTEASVDGASPDRLCAAGRYGGAGQGDSQCSGPCAAGYFCPAGSSSPQQNECGSSSVYCPESSGSPVPVTVGYYSEGESASRRSRQAICPVGHYCEDGARHACPAGTYGADEGLAAPSCSGLCREGYFCPVGSTTDTEQLCGIGAHPAGYYCPAGTASRLVVDSGEYSTPESAPESQRTGKAACPAGFACKDGAKNPSMFFGSSCPDGKTTRTVSELQGDVAIGAPLELALEDGVTATFALQSVSPGSPSLFALQQWSHNGTVQLRTGQVGLNFQTSPEHTVLLRATASTGSSDTVDCTITVAVLDVNQAPVFQTVEPRTVPEGSPVNEEVGAALSSEVDDPDFGQALDFKITSGNGAGMFKINSCSGQIYVAKRGLDSNVQTQYTLGIRVADDGVPSLDDTTSVTIAVIDRPDPPVLQAATLEVQENQPVGTTVGALNATDPDANPVFTFSIVRGSPVFGVRAASGEIFVQQARLNYELQRDYALRVRVTDETGLSDGADVIVRVLDGNDPPVLETGAVRYVRENSPAGTAVGAPLAVTDEDRAAGSGQTVGCEMATGGDAGGFFGVNATTCQLETTATAVLNYETKDEYTVSVRAVDSVGGQSAVQSVLIHLVDVNDPPFLANHTFSVSEAAGTGTVLGTLVADDEDTRQVHTYVIEQQVPATTPPMWSVGAFDGVLRLSGILDFEDQSLYTLTVRVRDNGHDPAPLAATATLTINVYNVPEPPVVTPPQLFLWENATVGTVLAQQLTATDPEGGPVTFEGLTFDGLNTEDADAATVLAVASDGTITLTASLDYEAETAYALLYKATDADGNTTQALAYLEVGDVDEPPVLLPDAMVPPSRSQLASVQQPSQYNRTTVEAADLGTRIGSPIVAVDSEGEGVTYSLHDAPGHAGNTSLVALASPTSGQLEVSDDLTAVTSIRVILRAADPSGKAVEVPIAINVDDSNLPPEFDAATTGQRSVEENSGPGVAIGQPLACTDGDQGDSVRFVIGAGNVGGLFAVDATTGQLSVAKDGLDYETEKVYTLSLSCEDDGTPQLSDTVTLTVNVLNVNEPPVIEFAQLSVPEHVPVGHLVGNISFSDPDADDQGQLTLMLQPASVGGTNPFRAAPDAGLTDTTRIEVADAVLNFESGVTQYTLAATVSDGQLTASANVEISVLNVNEPPRFTSASGAGSTTAFVFTAPENTTVGTAVGTLTAVDPDADTTLTFTRVSGGNGVLDVQPDGRVTVAGAGLDWEEATTHQLVVRVEDNGIPFNRSYHLGQQGTTTVDVTNVNDATITVVAGTLRSNTSGEAVVHLQGSNLGVTASRGAPTPVRVYYRQPGNERRPWYEAQGCTVTTQNTEVTCTTAPGVGFGMAWRVEVGDGQGRATAAPPAVAAAGYLRPSLTEVKDAAGLATGGGQAVRLVGDNLGPAGTGVTATVAAVSVVRAVTPTFSSSACVVTQAHREVTCDSPAGYGAQLKWSLSVGGQSSDPLLGGGYAAPVITAVNATGLLDTRGGEVVVVDGQGFGDAVSAVSVTYGPTGREYVAVVEEEEGITLPHRQLRCRTVPGVGGDLRWRVTVGGQESNATAAVAAYTHPRIDAVQVVGGDELVTSGGQTLLIEGEHFGPSTPLPGGIDAPSVSYGETGTEFAATACEVTEGGARITCASAPGTGRDLVWTVTLGGQPSNALATAVRYASPVVLGYAGPGADGGSTAGGERVVIRGRQFGTVARNAITRVTYRVADAAEPDGPAALMLAEGASVGGVAGTRYPPRDPADVVYEAQGCKITKDHVELVCETAPGAGSDLRWSVVVDGQPSRDASTAYSAPAVDSLSGLGAADATTEGGQVVILHGSHFGPAGNASFLDRVTYGPAGFEYVARDCVVVSHTQIECTTAPGVGSSLRWSVEVGGQLSEASVATTSFAAPAITGIAPTVAPAAGGDALVLNGTDLGLQDPQASLRVLLAGRPLKLVATRMLNATLGQIEAVLPAGVGAGLEVVVETFRREGGSDGAQRSSPAHFSYEAPVVELVTTAEVPGEANLVQVIVRGRNFGPSPDAVANVRIGPRINPSPSTMVTVTDQATMWADGEVRVSFDGTEGTVDIVAGGQASNAAIFRNINPSLSVEQAPPRIVAGTASEVGGLPLTQGGATLEITGQYFSSSLTVTLGGRNCPVTGTVIAPENSGESRVNCTIPAGQGARPQLVVMADGTQPSEPRTTIPYQPPSVTSITTGTAPASLPLSAASLSAGSGGGDPLSLALPTEGGTVTLSGRNFGLTPTVTVGRWPAGATTLTPSQASHSDVVVTVPAGQGAGLLAVVAAGDQTSDSSAMKLDYAPPVVDSVAPATGPTQGNVTLDVKGTNFGVASPTVRVGGTLCDLLPGHSHTEARCVLREGQGAALPVTVAAGGQNSGATAAAPSFAFQPPVVLAVTPRTGRTAGGENVTVTGGNFGLFPAVTLVDLEGGGAAVSAPVLWRTHNALAVTLPSGQGAGKAVVVSAGGQSSEQAGKGPAFAYAPPRVDSVDPSHGPTDGEYDLTLQGDNFGSDAAGASVTVGPYSCPVQSQPQHDTLVCRMPAGIGAGLDVVVTVSGQQSNDDVAFSFDPPTVSVLVPNVPDAEGEEVDIRGNNFGVEGTDTEVLVSGQACAGATWVRDATYNYEAYIRCRTPRGEAGWKNVTLTVAKQTARVDASDRVFKTECKRGWYGRDGELCLPCPRGATCEGEGEEPIAEPGWFNTPLNTPDDRCPAERQERRACPFIVPCEPKDACTGNNSCAAGYTGVRCASCAPDFYRRAGLCEVCPQNPLLLLLGFLVACIVLCGAGWTLHRKQVSVAFFSIGVDYFQVLALFGSARVAWPEELLQLYHALSVFNLNLELTAPECSLDVTFERKWWFTMALPIGALVFFLSLYAVKYLQKRLIQRRRRRLHSHLPALIGVALTMLYYLYLYIVRTTLDIFNCSPTDPPDGNEYMEAVFVKCYEPGGLHMRLLPFAIIFVLAYGVGYPVLLGWLLWRNQQAIRQDQTLRARGLGDTRLTNPDAYEVRKRLHKTYYHFKPEFHWWTLAILGRKFLIAFAALMFRKNVSFQLAVVLLVLFVSYTMQVKYRPYMSVSEHNTVWRDMQARAAADPTGWRALVVSKVGVAERKAARQQRSGRKMWSGDGAPGATTRAAQASEFVTNYNTVESVLLFCAVIVCLSGIMFESGRFEGDYFAVQRDVITWIVVVIVAGSILYFGAMLALEIGTYLAPECVRSVRQWASGKRERVDSDSEGEGDESEGADGAADDGMELAAKHTSVDALGFNPMFMQSASQSDRDLAQAAAAGSWDLARFKQEYDKLAAKLTDVQASNQRLVQQLHTAKKGATLGAAAQRADGARFGRGTTRVHPSPALRRKKKVFDPVDRPAAGETEAAAESPEEAEGAAKSAAAAESAPVSSGAAAAAATLAGPAASVPAEEWHEATDPEGRVYFYNRRTKETRWEKPE